jgi:acyl carrier protein
LSAVGESEARAALMAALAPVLAEAGVEPAAVGDDFDLIGSGLVDSLGLLELIGELEDRLGIELDFEGADPERLPVVGELIAHVTGAAAPPAPG